MPQAHWTQDDVIANGIRLHYYRTGDGDKPTVVLAHGFSDNGLCWTPVAEALEDEYDIVMYDARGHGLSDAPEADVYGYDQQAADLAGLIQALNLWKPALLGHSMGGATIATASALYPDLPSCILLEDPPLRRDEDAMSAEEWASSIAAARAKAIAGKSQTREAFILQCREENPSWPEVELGPWADAKLQHSPNSFTVRLLPEQRWQDTMVHIPAPILLITGDPERGAIVTAEVATEAESLWQQGRVAHIPGTGHSIRRENFQYYLAEVRSFLQQYANPV